MTAKGEDGSGMGKTKTKKKKKEKKSKKNKEKMVLKQLDIHSQTMNFQLYLVPHTNIYSKCSTELNAKPKIIKTSRRNHRRKYL